MVNIDDVHTITRRYIYICQRVREFGSLCIPQCYAPFSLTGFKITTPFNMKIDLR